MHNSSCGALEPLAGNRTRTRTDRTGAERTRDKETLPPAERALRTARRFLSPTETLVGLGPAEFWSGARAKQLRLRPARGRIPSRLHHRGRLHERRVRSRPGPRSRGEGREGRGPRIKLPNGHLRRPSSAAWGPRRAGADPARRELDRNLRAAPVEFRGHTSEDAGRFPQWTRRWPALYERKWSRPAGRRHPVGYVGGAGGRCVRLRVCRGARARARARASVRAANKCRVARPQRAGPAPNRKRISMRRIASPVAVGVATVLAMASASAAVASFGRPPKGKQSRPRAWPLPGRHLKLRRRRRGL